MKQHTATGEGEKALHPERNLIFQQSASNKESTQKNKNKREVSYNVSLSGYLAEVSFNAC